MAKVLVGVRVESSTVKFWKGVSELKDQPLSDFLVSAVDAYVSTFKERDKVDLLRQAYGLPKMKR